MRRQYAYLGEVIRHEAGLPSHTAEHDNRDTDSTAANRRSVLTTSYANIPLDILVASDEADSDQVVQRLDELRKDGRRTERHAVLIAASQRQLGPQIQGAYRHINVTTYGYDYPVWCTKHLSLFRILEPPCTRGQTMPIEARFCSAGISMELRVLEFPAKIRRHHGRPIKPLECTPAEWPKQDMAETRIRILMPRTGRTQANRSKHSSSITTSMTTQSGRFANSQPSDLFNKF